MTRPSRIKSRSLEQSCNFDVRKMEDRNDPIAILYVSQAKKTRIEHPYMAFHVLNLDNVDNFCSKYFGLSWCVSHSKSKKTKPACALVSVLQHVKVSLKLAAWCHLRLLSRVDLYKLSRSDENLDLDANISLVPSLRVSASPLRHFGFATSFFSPNFNAHIFMYQWIFQIKSKKTPPSKKFHLPYKK